MQAALTVIKQTARLVVLSGLGCYMQREQKIL